MALVLNRLMALEIEGDDVSDDVSNSQIRSEVSDRDWTPLSAGRSFLNRTYYIDLTIAQDHAAGTTWTRVWESAGDEVEGVYAPYNNTTPTVAEPHYAFTAVVSEPEGVLMGGEGVDITSDQVATIEVSWKLTGKPTKVTA